MLNFIIGLVCGNLHMVACGVFFVRGPKQKGDHSKHQVCGLYDTYMPGPLAVVALGIMCWL